MDQQPCITDTFWLGYSNKTLSQSEIDMIHHHAETCEVCADIKEGIDAMSQPEILGNKVSNINNKVDRYLEPKRKLGILFYWSAAAILIFGIGLSWFWVNTNQPIVKINTDSLKIVGQTEEKLQFNNEPNTANSEPEQKEIPLAVNETPSVKQVPLFETKDREDDSKMQVEDIAASSMDDLDKITETKKLPDTSRYVITPPKDTIPRGITLAFENRVNTTGSYNNVAPPSMESYSLDNVDVLKKTESVSVIESESTNKRKANSSSRKASSTPAPMSNSNVNNDVGSNTYTVSKYLNLNDSNNFALAKSYFSQNKFAKCIESLKPITGNPFSPYYEEGLFLKAQALIKLKKAKEAKVILKTIISYDGEFKSAAEKLISGLK